MTDISVDWADEEEYTYTPFITPTKAPRPRSRSTAQDRSISPTRRRGISLIHLIPFTCLGIFVFFGYGYSRPFHTDPDVGLKSAPPAEIVLPGGSSRRTLILHIGQDKTGTTYTQRRLGSNCDTLLAQGFVYPQRCPEHQFFDRHLFYNIYGDAQIPQHMHENLNELLHVLQHFDKDKSSTHASQLPPDLEYAWWFFVRVLETTPPTMKLIWSNEGLFHIKSNGWHKIMTAAKLYDYDVRTVYVYRALTRRMQSLYTQGMKTTSSRGLYTSKNMSSEVHLLKKKYHGGMLQMLSSDVSKDFDLAPNTTVVSFDTVTSKNNSIDFYKSVVCDAILELKSPELCAAHGLHIEEESNWILCEVDSLSELLLWDIVAFFRMRAHLHGCKLRYANNKVGGRDEMRDVYSELVTKSPDKWAEILQEASTYQRKISLYTFGHDPAANIYLEDALYHHELTQRVGRVVSWDSEVILSATGTYFAQKLLFAYLKRTMIGHNSNRFGSKIEDLLMDCSHH
eukprot:scaffold49990_cov64-Attheya_sp.AAC.2